MNAPNYPPPPGFAAPPPPAAQAAPAPYPQASPTATQGFAPPLAQAQGDPSTAALFAAMGTPQVFSRGAYFDGPGEYEGEVIETIQKVTTGSGLCVIFSFRITKSSRADVPVGSQRGTVLPVSKRQTASTMLDFLAAVFGVDTKTPQGLAYANDTLSKAFQQLFTRILSSEQPLTGRKVRITSRHHKTKKEQVITVQDFAPAEGVTPWMLGV
jgi:hypothetical protein